MNNLLEIDNVKEYVFRGNAIFTVINCDTNKRFTYKVIRTKTNKHKSDDFCAYWVYVLTMPNNDIPNNYKFIGGVSKALGFIYSNYSYIKSDSLSVKAARWFFGNLLLNRLSNFNNIKTFYSGNCARCGKLLTVPDSIVTGFGPDCMKMELLEGNTEPAKLYAQWKQATIFPEI